MWRDEYVAEKLRDLAAARRERPPLPLPARPRAQPGLSPLARFTGRTLRRLGEGLEAWAAAQHEPRWEQPRYQRR